MHHFSGRFWQRQSDLQNVYLCLLIIRKIESMIIISFKFFWSVSNFFGTGKETSEPDVISHVTTL